MGNTKIKKISLSIVIFVLVAAFVLGATWLGLNWSSVTSGSTLYTESELKDYGDDRYQSGLEKGEEFRVLAEKYKLQVQEVEGNITKVTILLEQEKAKNNGNLELIATLEETVAALQAQKIALQNEVTRLTGLLQSYEDIKNGTYEINFYADDSIVKTIAVSKGKGIEKEIEIPTKDGFIFDYWAVEGVQIEVSTYVPTKDTNIHAVFFKDCSGMYMLFLGNETETSAADSLYKMSITDGFCSSLNISDGVAVNISTITEYRVFRVQILQSGTELYSFDMTYSEGKLDDDSKVYFYTEIEGAGEYTFAYARLIRNGSVVYE